MLNICSADLPLHPVKRPAECWIADNGSVSDKTELRVELEIPLQREKPSIKRKQPLIEHREPRQYQCGTKSLPAMHHINAIRHQENKRLERILNPTKPDHVGSALKHQHRGQICLDTTHPSSDLVRFSSELPMQNTVNRIHILPSGKADQRDGRLIYASHGLS